MPLPPKQSIRQFLSGVIPLLRRDAHFRMYLLSRAAIALGFVGHNFLTAAALERFNLPNSEVGVFTAALLIAQALGDLGLGALADHWGHKQVLELSTLIGVIAIMLAIFAPTPSWFILIFVLVGVAQAGYTLSGFTLAMSFAGDADRPTYIGVANTALAPVAIFGPLMTGALAEFAGYEALFGLLILIGIVGLTILHRSVTAPKAAYHEA
jgi:MFS family permease